MGFSENGSKRAAIAVQNSSGEAAMEWVFACRSAVKRGPSLYTYTRLIYTRLICTALWQGLARLQRLAGQGTPAWCGRRAPRAYRA